MRRFWLRRQVLWDPLGAPSNVMVRGDLSGEVLVVDPSSGDGDSPIELTHEHRMLALRDELLVEAGILLKGRRSDYVAGDC